MVIITCVKCPQQLRVPNDRGRIRITCPACGTKWEWTPDEGSSSQSAGADRRREKMTKDDLPKVLYVPTRKRASGTSQQVQYRDSNMRFHVPIFGDAEKAGSWFEWFEKHGSKLEPHTELRLPFVGTPVVEREALSGTNLWAWSDRILDFEPDVGSLFSPTDRQIDMSDS
jgi:hypothetical protein